MLEDASNFYLSQGVLGVSCGVLITAIGVLWRYREKDRLDHKADIAAKDALIKQLQDERLKEAIAARDAINSATTNSSFEALIQAMSRKGST